MSIHISGGQREDGVLVGNLFDKYGSRNPIVRWLMSSFEEALLGFVNQAHPTSIHEIGCGEGYWVLRWNEQGFAARGSDFSKVVIELAQKNALARGFSASLFQSRSIYELDTSQDGADLVVCCEVLEHLEYPVQALEVLQQVVGRYLILSVPREPIWRLMNMVRGKYLAQMGNTPGHLQHWSQRRFVQLVARYFQIVEIKSPLPWTMLLCRRRDSP